MKYDEMYRRKSCARDICSMVLDYARDLGYVNVSEEFKLCFCGRNVEDGMLHDDLTVEQENTITKTMLRIKDMIQRSLVGKTISTIRQQIYDAINKEREYQAGWEDPTLTTSGGQHSIQEFLTYIQSYTNEALEVGCRKPDPTSNEFGLHALRKIAALAVAAMEQWGVRERNPEHNLKERHV